MLCGCVLQRVHSGDGCELASTLRKYDFRKVYLFLLSLGKGATSEAGMCLFRAANVCAVFCYCLLWLESRDSRCVYITHVCFYVRCSDCVGVCGNVCCEAGVGKDSD